jgi:7-carboxy-7-deazaguanine synthase
MITQLGVYLFQEVFASIQGESTDTGLPCVFVRFYGCGINCRYCDQPQTPRDRKKIGIKKLLKMITAYEIRNVCITGGEPLVQWDNVYMLVLELVNLGYNVSIETSGCFPIEEDYYERSYKYVMDVKCPSSGVAHKNILDNLMVLKEYDEVKFVINDEDDYKFMKKVISQYSVAAKILVSPCFKNNVPVIGSQLVEWILRDKLFNVRVQIQVHKCLGVS